MSPELKTIMAQARTETRERIGGYRAWLHATTVIIGSFQILPQMLTGEARWLGRDAIQIGPNVISVDGVVRS